MKKEDCIHVVFLAQELQEDHEDGFHLTGWVNDDTPLAVLCPENANIGNDNGVE